MVHNRKSFDPIYQKTKNIALEVQMMGDER